MEFWKFALFGITGDLASRKILPALSRFASRNANDVSIDLVGYSRSLPSTQAIEAILNQGSGKQQHNLSSVNYIQADYDDRQAIKELFKSLKPDQKLYIYLAVPPNVIIDFLRISAQLLNANIHIIIEKPFGRDSSEGATILKLLEENNITDNVHFIDHYLFKSAVRLSSAEKDNFRFLATKPIRSLHIHALEILGIEDRKGYYSVTGAFKDMFSHLYSLAYTTFDLLGRSIHDYSLLPQSIYKGQYKTFLNDINEDESAVETYFDLTLDIKPHDKSATDKFIISGDLESGKKLLTKQTYIHVEFRDDSELVWDLSPGNSITYVQGIDIKQIHTQFMELSDHENMFTDLLKGNLSSFITAQEVTSSWELYDSTTTLAKFTKPPVIYKDCKYPLKVITK